MCYRHSLDILCNSGSLGRAKMARGPRLYDFCRQLDVYIRTVPTPSTGRTEEPDVLLLSGSSSVIDGSVEWTPPNGLCGAQVATPDITLTEKHVCPSWWSCKNLSREGNGPFCGRNKFKFLFKGKRLVLLHIGGNVGVCHIRPLTSFLIDACSLSQPVTEALVLHSVRIHSLFDQWHIPRALIQGAAPSSLLCQTQGRRPYSKDIVSPTTSQTPGATFTFATLQFKPFSGSRSSTGTGQNPTLPPCPSE